jgi:protoporphyrinogen oxidase
LEKFDVVFIGGGISGMSLAHFCAQRGWQTALLEKERRLGGAIRTEQAADGFWVEMGAHTCYNSYGLLLGILQDRDLLRRLIRREKAPWLFHEEGRLRSVAGKLHPFELLASLPRLFTAQKRGRSVEAYYSRVLGRRNFAEVARPMLDAVACQDVRDFPAELLFKRRPRRKEIPRSFTLDTGLQAIMEGIAEGGAFTVRSGQGAGKVTFSSGRFRVQTAGRKEYEARALALAAGPVAGAKLLRGPFPELAETLARIEERELTSVAVAVDKNDVVLPRAAGIVPLNDTLYSVVSRDVVPHPDLRGFAFHFRPGTDGKTRDRCIADLLGVAKADWKLHRSRTHRLPAPVVGHERIVSELDRHLAGKSLAITGNYFGGLAMEDCVARSAAEAERLAALL